MARVIGNAGRSAAMEAVLARWVLPIFVGIGLLPVAAILMAALRQTFGLAAFIAGTALSLWWWRKDYADMWRSFQAGKSWKKGAEGERAVGDELAKLPDEYVVFHDYHFKSGDDDWSEWNVDHIVVGPNGVWVLETKNYGRQKVRSAALDSLTRRNVGQVRQCAMDLKKRLVAWSNKELEHTFVEGWLVYAQDRAQVDRQWEGQTHVIPLKWLVRDILKRPKRDIDWEQGFRVALVLWKQMSPERRELFAESWAEVIADHKLLRDQHLAKIRAEKEAAATQPKPAIPIVCPNCGAQLVKRTARKGPRAGLSFLGCSEWQHTGCKFVFNLDEPAA